MRGKTPIGKANPNSPFYKAAFPKSFAHGKNDLTQKAAKQFMPPHCSIWRSNYRGASCPRAAFAPRSNLNQTIDLRSCLSELFSVRPR